MKRIVIIGCGGSGKTYLARRLAQQLVLPLTHLDAVYYDEQWNPLPADVFAAAQERLVAQPRWIIEGNYAGTLPVRLAAADTVILLDLPARTCLLGLGQRHRRHGAGQEPTIGVYNRINANFIRYVLRYRRFMLPRVRRMIADRLAAGRSDRGPPPALVVLRSRRDIRRFLDNLPGAATNGRPQP